jgi:hypothetical protein
MPDPLVIYQNFGIPGLAALGVFRILARLKGIEDMQTKLSARIDVLEHARGLVTLLVLALLVPFLAACAAVGGVGGAAVGTVGGVACKIGHGIAAVTEALCTGASDPAASAAHGAALATAPAREESTRADAAVLARSPRPEAVPSSVQSAPPDPAVGVGTCGTSCAVEPAPPR